VKSGLTLLSDARHLRRVVQNLVANAVRYTRKGRILIGARRRGPMALIQVWDTGPGIPGDQHGVIFEEFRRLNNDAPNEPKAMGLGLAIVDRIARLLDHAVSVRSVVGKGSCFSVAVPWTEVIAESAPADPAPPPSAASMAGRTALVIENDLPILEGMIALLERWKLTAVPMVSMQEALDCLDTLQTMPDLILADYHLDNGETGLDAISAIRTATGRKIPAILITADRTPRLRQEAGRLGIEILHKPAHTEDLAAAMSKVLG
jgi:two-component system, sensor histidine kinase